MPTVESAPPRLPLADRLRDVVARRVVHPLQGMTVSEWWATLRRHRFAIDRANLIRAAVQSGLAGSNSVNAHLERLIYGQRIAATRVEAPLFILGHYRSGTTHLHNLLALNPHFAAPNFFQALNPATFLVTERWGAPLAARLMVRQRFMDAMALAPGLPAEDELGLAVMTGLSPYLAWCFPGDGVDYDRYLTFHRAEASEVQRWGDALVTLLRKLTFRHGGRPLVLKSPPHTARVRLILDRFPDARFVFIHRDPFAVFRSTQHMVPVLQPVFQLQSGPIRSEVDRILAVYTEMHAAYRLDRNLIPPGRLVEVAYADLERDPMTTVASIHRELDLPGVDDLRPQLDAYLGTIADYRKNRHVDLPDALRSRITTEWDQSFTEWGYER